MLDGFCLMVCGQGLCSWRFSRFSRLFWVLKVIQDYGSEWFTLTFIYKKAISSINNLKSASSILFLLAFFLSQQPIEILISSGGCLKNSY
jgi:hypothetical protein